MAQGAYVFGYGSRIEKESRTRTNPEAAEPGRLELLVISVAGFTISPITLAALAPFWAQ